MPEDTLPIDRPTVVFNDEDGPGALVASPEAAGGAANGAAESAAAVLLASSVPAVAQAEPGSEAAMADVSAAAAGVVESSGDGAASGAVATAAVSAKGGGAQSAGAAFQISEEIGLAVATYQRGKARPADPKLLKLFINDDHLVSLWNEIGRVELEAVELSKGSPRMVRELIDRLSVARNLLLSDRDQYEDVLRELNIVKNNILRVRHSNRAQQPFTIQIFLYAIVAIVALLFIQGPSIAVLLGNRADVLGISTQVLWNSLLWGGIGGLSAAFYALVKHVEDYDPQHARWYYLSPMIGLVFGPLVALLADVGLPALVQLVGTAPTEMEVRPAVMYLLAWAVGFQQQLVIYLLKTVVGRIVPGLNIEKDKQAEAARG